MPVSPPYTCIDLYTVYNNNACAVSIVNALASQNNYFPTIFDWQNAGKCYTDNVNTEIRTLFHSSITLKLMMLHQHQSLYCEQGLTNENDSLYI